MATESKAFSLERPDGGNALVKRIADASQATELFKRMHDQYSQKRGKINAKIQGAINGNPPIPQEKLDREGLSWMSNVNFRLLEADVNMAQIPLYMLFADVQQYAQVKVNMPGVHASDNIRFGQIIGEEHTKLCDKWKQFDYQLQLSIANMAKYGSGNIYFPDKEDFRFKAAQQGTVFVPDESTQDLDELPMLFVYHRWSITDLYHAISNPKASEAGWNIEAVKELIKIAWTQSSQSDRSDDWEWCEQKLREGDVYWGEELKKADTVWGYVKEFDGKISRFLISRNYEGDGKFLYENKGEFDSWEQIINPFFYEIGNGNWNGVKGIGVKAYNFREAQNRLKNRMMDAAFLGSQVLVQAPDEKTVEKLQLIDMGPLSILPGGVTFNQMPLLSTLDKPIMVDRTLESDLQRNIGGMRQGVYDPQSGRPVTATEANINSVYASQVTQSQQTLWLRQMDDLWTEQFNRLSTPVRKPSDSYPLEKWEEMKRVFHAACVRRGVPIEAFLFIERVYATRSLGRGSEIQKLQTGMQIYSLMRGDPNVPQVVIMRHLKNLISNHAGREYLSMIWPEEGNVSPDNDASKAQDENAVATLGISPIWTDDQNNMSHFAVHVQFVSGRLQQVMQLAQQSEQQNAGGNPQVLQAQQGYLQLAQVALPHIQQHLEAMRGNTPGNMFQQLFNTFEQLQASTQQVAQNFQAGSRAVQQQQVMLQAQQQQELSKEAIAARKADAEIQRKNAESLASIKRLNLTTASNAQNALEKTKQDLAINDLETSQKIRNGA